MTTLETAPFAPSRPFWLLAVTGILTLVLCAVVAWHALPFGAPSVYTWQYKPLQAPMRALFACVPVLAAGLVLLGTHKRERNGTPVSGVKIVASLWLAAFVSVQAIILMNPAGYAYPATLVINPASNSYFSTALEHPDTAALLRNFPGQMPNLISHAQTQSAGPIVFSAAIKRLAEVSPLTNPICDTLLAFFPGRTAEVVADFCNKSFFRDGRLHITEADVRTALVVALFMLALSCLAVAPLYWLGNRLGGPGVGVFAALGFVLLPSFNVFSVSVDQMYPLVVALALCGVWRGLTAEKRGALWFALTGAWLGLNLFMNMGLIVAVALCGLFALLGARSVHKPVSALVGSAGAFIGGLLVPIVLLRLIWGYDLFAVFLKSNALRDSLYYNDRSYGNSLWANLLDFVAFCGIPFVGLWLWNWRRAASPQVLSSQERLEELPTSPAPRALSPYIALAGAFVVVVLLLDVSGRVRGEVARMWMFLTPPLLIGVGIAWRQLWRADQRMSWLVLALQGAQLGVLQYFVRVWGY